MRRLTRKVPRRFLRLLLLTFVISSLVLLVWLLFYESKHFDNSNIRESSSDLQHKANMLESGIVTVENKKAEQLVADVDNDIKEEDSSKRETYPPPNYDLHVFYYPWYGNPQFDGKYYHWNHQILPHWNKIEAKKWPEGRYEPPEAIGAQYYPSLGAYSSQDPEVLKSHMRQIRMGGSGMLNEHFIWQ